MPGPAGGRPARRQRQSGMSLYAARSTIRGRTGRARLTRRWGASSLNEGGAGESLRGSASLAPPYPYWTRRQRPAAALVA